jgi:hypothetical protein
VTIDNNTVTAARLLLDQLGLTPDDLRWTPVEAPTFADYLPVVRKAAGFGANRTYGSYWDRIHTSYGTRHLDEIAATDIEILMRETMANTVPRRSGDQRLRSGRLRRQPGRLLRQHRDQPQGVRHPLQRGPSRAPAARSSATSWKSSSRSRPCCASRTDPSSTADPIHRADLIRTLSRARPAGRISRPAERYRL